MPGKFCVSLTVAKDNPDKVTLAFVVANAEVASDKDTVVFLSTEGVRVAVKGYAGWGRRPEPLGDMAS
jgi:predicted peroxiredoxin